MVSPLLEPFREAYRNLELLPLRSDKELQRFAVEYGTEIIDELEQLVEDSPWEDGKIRFFVTWYGSIGVHKSTKSLSGKRLN
ncbi:MAG: hypothetical protein GPJ27_06635 [Microcystis aeruginosa L111-01]|nr:hypothetical protein [Microcystis aeruginosa L111-01]